MSVGGVGGASGAGLPLDATDAARGPAPAPAAADPAPAIDRSRAPARPTPPLGTPAVASPYGAAAASAEPISSLLARGDVPTLERVLDDIVLSRAPEWRLVELMSHLVMAARGNTPSRRLLAALSAQGGVSAQRLLGAMGDRADFDRLVQKHTLRSEDVVALARDAGASGALRKFLLRENFRAAVGGERPSAVDRLIAAAGPAGKAHLARLLAAALDDGALRSWVEGDRGRLDRAEALALRAQPDDPSIAENREVNAKVDAFRDWDRFPYALIVVPGFAPEDARAAPGVHPEARRRLEEAKKDFLSGKAPFVLLSGGNVHPPGTPYYEALEMKRELVAMGVPADRIIVDAAARHTTTNLRNAGRYMHAHGLGERRALVTTTPLQDFYLSNPWFSFFHARSLSELGYRVGELGDAPNGQPFADRYHSAFKPSREVRRIDWKQPLDP